MSTLQYVLRYHRRPELKAIGEFPDISIFPPAPLLTVNSSLGLPVIFVVVLESGESESEKENESTWFGSLLRTSASMPAVDWSVQRFKHVNKDITDTNRILRVKAKRWRY